jgi:predicted metal-dependent hydrolase
MQLPPYTVRESARAKHLNLRLSPRGELEVVIPVGYDRTEIPSVIIKHQDWLDRAQQRLASRQPQQKHLASEGLPSIVELRALNKTWDIEYTPAPVKHIKINESLESTVILWGNTRTEALARQALKKWLAIQGDRYLGPWLRRLSQDIGLPFRDVTCRGQKTLWGSCSQDKNISLNYKLLFLPAPLVHYVMVHELCHTQHMDHSKAFWNLVGQCERDYKGLDRDLNKAMQYVPRWLQD